METETFSLNIPVFSEITDFKVTVKESVARAALFFCLNHTERRQLTCCGSSLGYLLEERLAFFLCAYFKSTAMIEITDNL